MPRLSPARQARAYRRAIQLRERLWMDLNGAFDGFWLGVLDPAALARLDDDFYAAGRDAFDGTAFDYTSGEHNLRGLYDWEAEAIERHFPAGGRVVITGAGAGREVIALLRQGFDAIGFEPNATLVKAGERLLQEHGHAGRLRQCPRDGFPAEATACDAVVVGWGSYMLIPARVRRVEFLRAARTVLPDGAPLLCSFFVRPDDRYFVVVNRVAQPFRRLRQAPPTELGDSIGPNYMHYFTREEIASELAEAGFALVDFGAEPYGHAIARATPIGSMAPSARTNTGARPVARS